MLRNKKISNRSTWQHKNLQSAGDVSLMCLLVSQIIASRTIKINGRSFSLFNNWKIKCCCFIHLLVLLVSLFYSVISCCVCLWLCWMDNYSCKYRKLMYGSIVIFTIISAVLKLNVSGKNLKVLPYYFLFHSLELNLPRKLQNFLLISHCKILWYFIFLSYLL